MNGRLLGRFYFKSTINGNLIGEFSNNQSDKISTESSDLRKNPIEDSNLIAITDNYIGDYFTTWQVDNIQHFAELKIRFRINTGNQIYTLTWTEKGISIYIGEGMLCDNILIGDYQSV
jgi:hypothetical protein